MSQARQAAPRGVYRQPYTDELGRTLLVAVMSDGRRVAEVPVPTAGDRSQVWALLEQWLEREDPVRPRSDRRHLRLVDTVEAAVDDLDGAIQEQLAAVADD